MAVGSILSYEQRCSQAGAIGDHLGLINGHQGRSGAITTHLPSKLRCPEDEGHELIVIEAPHAV